jgi:hypothetical protein
LVANNFVIAGTGNTAAGIILNGNISGLKVFHNTVYCTEPVLAGGAALLLFQPATTQGPYRIINNLFIHAGAGLALRALSTGANFEIDHNNYHSNGANLANWVGTLCTDLAALQTASGQNQNSASKEVAFENPNNDLHLSSCSIGEDDLKGVGLPDVALLHSNGGNDSLTVYLNARWSLPTGVKDRRRASTPIGNFVLYQNYPNPFNPSTVISFQLPVNSHVTLKVFEVNGREVATLVEGEMSAGSHAV